MKKCEVCNKVARMYCESDEASLCWSCDSRVHSANFLVAKHTRTLLCHACQCLTPWTASGPKLGPTVSVCEACATTTPREMLDEDDAENQVVPLPSPPSLASTSSSDVSSSLFPLQRSISFKFSMQFCSSPEKAEEEEKNGGRSWKS